MELFKNRAIGLGGGDLKVFYFYLWWPFCSAERHDFSSIGRGSPKKHSVKLFLKVGHWSMRGCHLTVFLFLALVAMLFSGAERF